MPEFPRVASVGEVPPGEMMTVEVDGQEIVLANLEGEIVAFGNECTHRGGPLSDGILMGDVVECPWHSGQFNVRSGEVVGAPADCPIRTYEVRVEGDDVSVAQG
jgi:nitrite reductase (NADH) small subunit/3-phenylpropionate/trans-cinnamate dioxygenase ferredoxin subunit